ncbi:MAG TPA: hypothetical protein VHU23_13345 [Rhizomicrobium sp.]|jgi:hypothetical protein|nr:hypothetical protein [Rhizomicrobium sp.]
MKLTFLPTLTDLREMLGDRLYVEFVWMWREQEQAARTQDRRAKWAGQIPARDVESWPHPLFIRAESAAAQPEAKAGQVALLHPNIQRILEARTGKEPDWLKSLEVADGEPEAAATRARTAALRAAAE